MESTPAFVHEKTAIADGVSKLLLSNAFVMVKQNLRCLLDYLSMVETLANRTEPQGCPQDEGFEEASMRVQQLILDNRHPIALSTRTSLEYSWSEVNTFRTFIAAHSVTAYKGLGLREFLDMKWRTHCLP